MDDFRAILRENALGETPEVDKAHSTFVGLRDFDKQGLNIILHVRTPPSPFPCTCTPPPLPPSPALFGPPMYCTTEHQALECRWPAHRLQSGAVFGWPRREGQRHAALQLVAPIARM